MLRRLRASRALRIGFVLLAIGFLAYALISRWDETWDALSSLTPWSIGLALLAGVLAPGPAMLAWRALLADLGSPLSLGAAVRVMFVGQLGKYLPGGIWQVVATMELARDHAAPRRRTFTATVIGMAVTLATALAATAAALPFTSDDAVQRYWWALALVPLVAIALHPWVLNRSLNLALRLLRREPLERGVRGGALLRAVGWTLLGWLLLDVSAWLLVNDLHHGGLADFPPAAAAFMLAWSVGFLAIFAPGGVGAREAAMVLALAPVIDPWQALVIATVSRLISVVADLAWAGFALLLGRRAIAHGDDLSPAAGTAGTAGAAGAAAVADNGQDGAGDPDGGNAGRSGGLGAEASTQKPTIKESP